MFKVIKTTQKKSTEKVNKDRNTSLNEAEEDEDNFINKIMKKL